MSDFDDFTHGVLSGAEDLAKNTLHGFINDARNDAQSFLDKAKADLQRWTKMLAKQQLSQAEFCDLVRGQAALAEMHALTEAGIALARIQQFRDGLIDLVIDTAFKTFL
jgi:hypothetical protein